VPCLKLRRNICDELEEADLENLGRISTGSGELWHGDGEFRKGIYGCRSAGRISAAVGGSMQADR